MRTDILDRREDIERWIEEDKSKAFISRELLCKPATLERYLAKMGIVYKGNQPGRGKQDPSYIPVIEYLGTNKTIKSFELKKKLFREGIKEEKCEICGITDWQGESLPLELHHKNNNHYDNSLDNLIVLCPNCHAVAHCNV